MNKEEENRIISITQRLSELSIKQNHILSEESDLQQEFNSIVAARFLQTNHVNSKFSRLSSGGRFQVKGMDEAFNRRPNSGSKVVVKSRTHGESGGDFEDAVDANFEGVKGRVHLAPKFDVVLIFTGRSRGKRLKLLRHQFSVCVSQRIS